MNQARLITLIRNAQHNLKKLGAMIDTLPNELQGTMRPLHQRLMAINDWFIAGTHQTATRAEIAEMLLKVDDLMIDIQIAAQGLDGYSIH